MGFELLDEKTQTQISYIILNKFRLLSNKRNKLTKIREKRVQIFHVSTLIELLIFQKYIFPTEIGLIF